MKKLFMLALSATLVVSSFAACNNNAAASTESSKTSIEQTTVTPISTDGSVQLPNPYMEHSTLEEAAAAAGFDLLVPDKMEGYPEKIIRTLVTEESQMIEVIYRNEEENEIRIRKATGSDDISGDYNDYEHISTLKVGEIEVTTKGNGDKVSLATWTNNDYTFSISFSTAISNETLSTLIAAIR